MSGPSTFDAGSGRSALDAEIDLEPVAPDQVVSGSPTAGYVELADVDGTEVGVWEMTAGAASDTEADEVFVVIAGSARIEFVGASSEGSASDDASTADHTDDTDGAAIGTTIGTVLEVGVGDVVHLHAGDRTIWTVTERIRKVYVTPGSPA